MAKRILLCDCLGSQSLDTAAIAASGLTPTRVHTGLCMHEAEAAANGIADGETLVACGQEIAFFEMLAEELGIDAPGHVDLRDRAGWSDEAEHAGPKQAALAAEAQVSVPAARAVDVVSEGTCLILGAGEAAFEAAALLCDTLAVTVLQTDTAEPPADRRFDVVRGRIARAEGTLGQFRLRIDALQQLVPGGRGAFSFSQARDGATSECDILLDLTAETPLFPAPQKREGYLRADPRQPGALNARAAEARDMVGTFEKPLYVRAEPALCAHSRSRKIGCTNCLDICPTGAISPDGDHVSIDPMICAGCGACSAVCPSGAITYDAPPVSSIFRRIDVLLSTYRKAGGRAPRLLVHDAEFGREMIGLAARFGRGLPADVVPFEIDAIAAFGHAEMMAALGAGATGIDVLMSPKTERETPEAQAALTDALAGGPRARLLDLADPDALPEALYGAETAEPVADPALPIGTRRQVTRVAASALHPEGGTHALPDHAPYGAVLCDTDACTLCLACVSVCPSGALGDNADKPQLLFQEDACLQCGLCETTCPENAITLEPRMNLNPEALSQQVLNEEEPALCIECGTPFGVQSTIDRIADQLAGKHSMFATGDAARMIRMCDDCRVRAQYHSQNNPYAAGDRPRPRTTDDYLNTGPSKRRDH